jgi:flagellar basal-body rod protein FlgC
VLENAAAVAGSDRADDKRANGVQVARIVEDHETEFPVFYQPGHPDADESGKVLGSNVDLFQELVDMTVVERGFDANLTALRTYRSMLQNTITNMSR